ncbi:Peroxisomal adenine nucleotide carrier 1 [Seminavis robusta]|uniref:Peroxisomal adenine nucleotide carrier 1 n=1 Tax=Seminavis robusta TaxID=568900 RepID=A0A9N8D6G0_9STRA|nr:Peroxisomal adenine nucleotide carrier 1 [Seminavis robusta]|eukprot:Sro1_g000590.1 Peroxisomal adenine nucleotide carrier 1 (433) ;mRNA; r:167676-168974
MSSQPQSTELQRRRRKALADALAGVVATLVSLWTFYPIDVLKTKLQAGVVDKGSSSFFRGLPIKTLHAASSSFCYFYLYSFIVSWWTQGNQKKPMSPAVRLSLSAIAAMLNTLITLPLDVLASKSQASHDDDDCSTAVDETQQEESDSSCSADEEDHLKQKHLQAQQFRMDQVWRELEKQPNPARAQIDGEVFYDSCSEAPRPHSNQSSFDDEEKQEEQDNGSACGSFRKGNLTVTVRTTSARAPEQGSIPSKKQTILFAKQTSGGQREEPKRQPKQLRKSYSMESLSDLPPLWKGLYPSLLLCSNPSIHYTVFDMAKSNLLRRTTKSNLSMTEAFLLGLFAKFCATMATYPLIRAKVMIMVTHRSSMLATLIESYRSNGMVKGWYKGCSVQLLHTVLKSALLMMVKERIATTTHRLLVPSKPAATAAGVRR